MENTSSIPEHLTVRIPAWLPEIESLTKETTLVPDRLRFILHQVFLSWVRNKRILKGGNLAERNRIEGYFSISSEVLKQAGGKYYVRYIQFLEEANIIRRYRNYEGNLSYLVGNRFALFTWVLLPHFKNGISFRNEQVADAKTIKAMLRAQENDTKKSIRVAPGVPADYIKTFQTLKEYTEQIVLPGIPHFGTTGLIQDLFVERIACGELSWHSVCEFGNRYHNQYTTLSKKHRQYIRFKGMEGTPLITLDFANSQPYFSSILGSGNLIEQLLPEFAPVLPIFKAIERKPDYLLYRRLCANGELYQYFEDVHKLSKKGVKEKLFEAVLFAKKRLHGANKLFAIGFKTVFPSVVQMATGIRKMDEKDLPLLKHIINPTGANPLHKKSNDSHKIIPAMMQRAESRIMYGHIVPEMIRSGIGPLLTIHDSVMILPQHEAKAREIIAAAFLKFGVNPPTVNKE